MANQIMYGFFDLEGMFDQRVEDIGYETVTTAVANTIAEHNRQLTALTSLFVTPTQEYKVRFESANAARLQPLDSFGRARPIQPSGSYEVAYPMQDAGIAWGANFRARAKMRVGEVNRVLQTMTGADMRWMRDHILAALFTNVTWTYPDVEHGDLTIKGLANSDTDPYGILTGTDQPTTDTHYLAQAAAIADATDPYPVIYTELMEHPENGGEVIVFIPTASKATTIALAGFNVINDPKVRRGSTVDVLVATLDTPVPGTLLGYHDSGCWIVEWPILPTGYLLGVCTQGDRALGMREEKEAELRGFTMIGEREDYPFWEAQYLRIAGFGAWNRVGAVVYRIGNGTYAIPTNYTSPMV